MKNLLSVTLKFFNGETQLQAEHDLLLYSRRINIWFALHV
jgi:hypothetical protein